jgi:glucose-1-phosphate thymidylyltransferase
MLGFLKADNNEQLVANTVSLENSKIIEPCFIGENVKLINSIIGPNVSIGKNCVITDSTVKNSLIQTNTIIKNANLDEAMIGNHVKYDGDFTKISIGDYSVLE